MFTVLSFFLPLLLTFLVGVLLLGLAHHLRVRRGAPSRVWGPVAFVGMLAVGSSPIVWLAWLPPIGI